MNIFSKKKKEFPAAPEWKPSFNADLDEIISIFRHYTNNKSDFVVFANLTLVLIEDGLDDNRAIRNAIKTLSKIYNYHPYMEPHGMDDGNLLISYSYPAFNIAVEKTAKTHWKEIQENHRRALCSSEVMFTSLSPKDFDDVGKKALWARCYFFMDAQNPEVVRIVRNRD